MPRGDHRGPNAEGPRTGRGMGFCRGAGSAGLAKQGATIQEGEESQGGENGGRGHGRGRHRRRRRHLFHATGLTGWQRETLAAETSQTHETEPTSTTDADVGQQSLAALQQQADRIADELDQVRQQIREFQNRQESNG
jgi:hypothetical protein